LDTSAARRGRWTCHTARPDDGREAASRDVHVDLFEGDDRLATAVENHGDPVDADVPGHNPWSSRAGDDYLRTAVSSARPRLCSWDRRLLRLHRRLHHVDLAIKIDDLRIERNVQGEQALLLGRAGFDEWSARLDLASCALWSRPRASAYSRPSAWRCPPGMIEANASPRWTPARSGR
jgi:hypothetical protein